MNDEAGRGRGASSPRTTVIITTHNYGRYVTQCIDSVLGQSRPPACVLVLDDASEDNTADVLLGYAPQITCHRVEFRNAQRTRNFGLARASTEFVLFVDADDYLERTAIATLEDALDRAPAARVAYCDKNVFGDAAAMKQLRLDAVWRAPSFSVETLQFRNFIMLTSLVRRAHIDAFDEHIRRLQDWDLWLGMLHRDSHAVHVPEALLNYRVHGENISIRQSELLERLKILVKHGLISLAPARSGPTTLRSVAILTSNAARADVTEWRGIAVRRGLTVRVIAGSRSDERKGPLARDSIVRDGPVVVQTAGGLGMEALLWRFSGAITDDRIDAVIVNADVRSISGPIAAFPSAGAFVRCELPLDGIMAAKSIEDLCTFTLSPAAARLLLYLQPAVRRTPLGRLRRAAAEFVEQRLAWRFRHTVGADRRQVK